MTGPSAKVRALVIERDEGRCVRCGIQLFDDDRPYRSYSLQHRRAKKMGGDRRPDTNAPQNLILVCGHATEPRKCHHAMEGRNSGVWEHGWVLKDREDPLEVPVTTWRGPIWLHADGSWTYVTDAGTPGLVTNPFTGAMERPVF